MSVGKRSIKEVEGDVLAHVKDTPLAAHASLAGCYTVYTGVQLCYSLSGSSVKVTLEIAGVTVASPH